MNRFIGIFLCFSINAFAVENFTSPFLQKINFSIDEGIVFYQGNEQPEIIIKEQLKYMFGILNEVDGGIDFPQLKIEIISNDLKTIHYQVSGALAWSKGRTLPHSFTMILPRHGDVIGLTAFLNKYQKSCSRKPANVASFWNYYRPHKQGCELDEADVLKINTRLDSIANEDRVLTPDYPAIFKDNILEMTVIMTKDKPQNINDISTIDMHSLCGNLVENECHRETFQNGARVVLHAFLLDNFGDDPQVFLSRIQSYLVNSDVVTYNGHSGMGANIESWMKYYPVKDKEKYQIIFLNSCDTFGYFKNEFLNGGNRQVILNATPNYFGTFANSNLGLMNKILANADFNEILLSLPPEQHPLVLSK